MTSRTGFLVLEDGSVFRGFAFGAEAPTYGEVVFSTSMTGYQEMLTDPSYAGQILVTTYPIVGNYGINDEDVESRRIQVRGFVVREDCEEPSHYRSRKTLSQYLAEAGVPGIWGVDTRALTRRLRTRGVMMGAIGYQQSPEEALGWLRSLPGYGTIDFVREVSTEAPFNWGDASGDSRIVVYDCGTKFNIMRILKSLGCAVTAVPATASAEDILALEPDGVVLSPGPGDPALLDYAMETVRGLVRRKPIFGICLGHQLLAHALGGRTFKLKFGHRGGNHPVKDLLTGRVYITAQNHGYAVDAESLPPEVVVSHINLNDGTVEGMVHRELPIFSIQYHSEASPGPLDNVYLFGRFLDMVRNGG